MLKVIVLVGLVITLSALQSGVPALLAQIREIKSDSESGKEFKNLLDLELSQGSKVDEVVDLIGDLLKQLKNDQQLEDLEHASKSTGFGLDIKQLERNLERLSAERTSTNQFVQDTTVELQALEQTILNLQAQLTLLGGREEDIRGTRADEQVGYQHRSQNNVKVLSALSEILSRLTNAVFQEQDKNGVALLEVDRVEIVEQIRRELGHNNPIAILVSLTSKFDVGTVTRIIEKLENIRDAIISGQVEEDEREVSAAQIFQSILQEISDVRAKLSQDFGSSTQLSKRKTNEKVIKERQLKVLNADVETTQHILLNTRNQSDQYEANYESRSHARSGEIKTVQAAYDLVSQQSKSLKAQAGF